MGTRKAVLAISAMALAVAASFSIEPVFSQLRDRVRDPGVRGGEPGAGGPIAGLSVTQQAFFQHGLEDFSEAEDIAEGVGPRMNLDGCGGCHAQPAIGGTSPAVNPQVAFASKDGGTDRVPAFIRPDGPVREARFVRNADGTPDGGVHALFTITGRAGAAGCNLEQPDFAAQLANKNVIFRIPTPVFGAGLIEQIPDSEILANQAASPARKRDLGIRGRANFTVAGRTISGQANRNGNDGTITRFGWKAQNVSLLVFSGEAYNVEMGITNELFQNERDQTPECQFAMVPNDVQNMDTTDVFAGTTAVQNFANFQRFLAPPVPSATMPGGTESIARGRSLFESTGCALCHTPALRTSNNTRVAALRDQVASLYSDLLLHDMGEGLADGISQGQAGPREFRTAPLWGLGQRIFFLHDGRTTDLIQAIRQHRSDGSEASRVVGNFDNFRDSQKQDLLNFLRSL
jgi:mono/diheme cytochrome c family protein